MHIGTKPGRWVHTDSKTFTVQSPKQVGLASKQLLKISGKQSGKLAAQHAQAKYSFVEEYI
jgi:hypothetical protein